MSKLGQWARCLAVAAALLSAAAPGHAEKWALLIGVERYQREDVAPLHCSVGDVEGIARALQEACGFPADHIFTLTSDATPDALPTRANITFRLDWLSRKVQPGDMFLFYFSGHGMLRQGRSYLLTLESDARTVATLEDTAYPVRRLQQLLDRVAAAQKLSFVDACRNDPVASRADASNLLSEEFARSVAVRARAGTGAAESEGAATFYACKPGQRAYEWPGKGRGFFSYFLEEGLRGAAADAAGRVTLDGLEAYLAARVPEASQREIGSRQEPWVERAGRNVGDLVLAQGQPRAPQSAVRELPTTATLRVTSEPAGATVTVDGTVSGTTPCDISVLLGAATERRVTVTVEREGFIVRKAEVTLYPGRVSEWREVKLEEGAGVYVKRGIAHLDKGDYDRAIADFDKAIALEPNLASAYADRGMAYGMRGDHDRAIADFDKAIALEPDLAEAYVKRGVAYAMRGDDDRAIADFDKAIALKPDTAEAYARRGVAYAKRGDYDHGIADLDKAIALEPDVAEAYATRGAAYGLRGDYDRAIADFGKEIALKPDLAGAYARRGTVYVMKGDYDRAIADFDKAIALEPDVAEAYARRGTAYAKRGDYDRAIADFDKAIALEPDVADAYARRGTAYAIRGDYDRAIVDLDKAIALEPNLAEAYAVRGKAHAARGDYDRAIADCGKAIGLEPDDAEAYITRGRCYALEGDYNHAIADYRKCLGLLPASDPRAAGIRARLAQLEGR